MTQATSTALLNGNNQFYISNNSATYSISEVQFPIPNNLGIINHFAGHDMFVLKDSTANVVAELDGLATAKDGDIIPIGFAPSDTLNTYEFNGSYLYQPSYSQATVASGSYTQMMNLWNAATSCAADLNSENWLCCTIF